MGDPAGIGPEITVKAWKALKGRPELAFAVIAPPRVLEQYGGRIETISKLSEASEVFPKAIPVLPIEGRIAKAGQPSADHAMTITESIERAVGRCLKGEADGVVTNPIAKEVLYEAGFKFPGHTEYLGELTQNAKPPYARGPVMMLAGGGLRVGLATVHLSLKDAAAQLSADAILNNARVMDGALKCDFGITAPRISLTGLNPHAGEGGALGMEERNIINPAARVLREEGLNVTDAQPADTLFHAEAREGYDAVLAMYHDQGLIPVKTLDFHGGVNITLGLPIVRTSPDHGTAFGIAGQNKARPDSLIAAIKAARVIANNRANYVAR
jgi:4-hydroxythreonine-4-phosphate dehydrogenase